MATEWQEVGKYLNSDNVLRLKIQEVEDSVIKNTYFVDMDKEHSEEEFLDLLAIKVAEDRKKKEEFLDLLATKDEKDREMKIAADKLLPNLNLSDFETLVNSKK